MSRKSKRRRHLGRYMKTRPVLAGIRGRTIDTPCIATALTTVASDMFEVTPAEQKNEALANAFWVAMQGLVGPERARQIAGA